MPTTEIAVEKKKLEKPPLSIHKLGDRVLRQPAKRVAKIDGELRQLVREMLQTMYSSEGIGLAAPQVGIHKQVVVIDTEPKEATHQPIVLINPVIKRYSQELCVFEEGCLSVPDVFMNVTRPEVIEVSFKDEYGRPQTLTVKDVLARVIQHELDHLNGVLFVDRVDNSLALNEALIKHGFSPKAVKSIH